MLNKSYRNHLAIAAALGMTELPFRIGGSTGNKYKPHQGKKECARRRKQLGLGEFRAQS